MQIRKTTLGDTRELARLIKELETSDDYLSEEKRQIRAFSNLDKAAEKAAKRYISQPEYISFVADENGSLKGFIAGEIKQKKYRVYNKEGFVELWFVEPKYQNHKIGKKLLDMLVKKFKEAGCTHVGLDTHLENTKAIHIYEHMGFTKRLLTFVKPLKDLP